jgi:hypothetical protein
LILALSELHKKESVKYFLTIIVLSFVLIKCTSKDNIVIPPCDTCGRHTDTSGSKTDTSKKDTTKVILDTVPVSITIQTGDQMVEDSSQLTPISITVIVKNKEGQGIKGVPVSFTAAVNSGSVNPASQKTDNYGLASATWTLNPQPDTAEGVVAKVIYNNIDLSVQFHASVIHNPFYNFSGTLIMDSTNKPTFLPFGDSTNSPDPFTIPSDPFALSNGVPYPFELDSIRFPHFQLGEHGEGGICNMTINHISYPVHVSYEVDGLILMETTGTLSYSSPETFTVTMQWELRGGGGPAGISGAAYLLETVSSPTRGTFTNSRTGTFTTTLRSSH